MTPEAIALGGSHDRAAALPSASSTQQPSPPPYTFLEAVPGVLDLDAQVQVQVRGRHALERAQMGSASCGSPLRHANKYARGSDVRLMWKVTVRNAANTSELQLWAPAGG